MCEINILFHTLFFWPGNVCYTCILHATCGQHVATAPCVSGAETRSCGIHTAPQVAEAPQAGPRQALTPSPGSPCPLPQTITGCSPHNFNQTSLNAACQCDAMFSVCKCTYSAVDLECKALLPTMQGLSLLSTLCKCTLHCCLVSVIQCLQEVSLHLAEHNVLQYCQTRWQD